MMLTLATVGAVGSEPTDPELPYTLPLAAPYNVNPTLELTTPAGDDQTVHPDVIDFGPAGWRGHRYWMGITPFPGGDPRQENPCIYVSADGYRWAPPEGLLNPLDPGTGQTFNANSDTDLVYDPVGDRLVLTYRRYGTGTKIEAIRMTHSSDGVTWSPFVVVVQTDGTTIGSVQQTLSQAVVRVSATDWRMWACGGNAEPDTVRTATDPYGPWSAPTTCTFAGTGYNPYHTDVIKGPDGRFWMLASNGSGRFFPAVSTNGVAWTSGAFVLNGRSGQWDALMYRATLQPHPNGTHMQVWYSAMLDDGITPPGGFSSQKWRTAYTLIARSHWLTL